MRRTRASEAEAAMVYYYYGGWELTLSVLDDGDDDGDKDDDLGFSLRCKMAKGRGEDDEQGGCQ